jgi:hypothetical protein
MDGAIAGISGVRRGLMLRDLRFMGGILRSIVFVLDCKTR